MIFSVVSIFPEMFATLSEYGITGRACARNIYTVTTHNPRDFVTSNYKRIDDTPYGGGHGMVMQAEPLELALHAAQQVQSKQHHITTPYRIFLSPQGKPATQGLINELATYQGIVLVCGRYEGVDERFITRNIDLEVSIGDFVVSGGELPAMLLMDAIIRHLPGALDEVDAINNESFMHDLLDYPQYTKPREYHGINVPEVLLSGNHAEIARWRLKTSLWRTYTRRPELLEKRKLTQLEAELLNEALREHEHTITKN